MYEPILELQELPIELAKELAKELPIEIAEELVSPELNVLYKRHARLKELKKMVEGIVKDFLQDIAEYDEEISEIEAIAEELL
jgi:hypothetical protein